MLLPKTSFALWSEPAEREAPFRERCTSELYDWQWKNAKGPLFVLHDGPPYANGNLHTGHALNKILKDIINRFHVLQGRRVSYVPGWDCHGLPIESKALEELKAGHEQVPPAKIREMARKVASRAIDIQREEFKQFGIMADWSDQGTYRTFDHDYEIRQLRVFQELVRKGLIYRHYRPVYWSPSSKSALAEAELNYEDNHRSFTVYVKFPVVKSGLSDGLRSALQAIQASEDEPVYFAIWTTTPWTLPANMALSVNPELEYVLVRRQEHPEEGLLVMGKERVAALSKLMGSMDVLTTLQGRDLLDTKYTHMFNPTGSALTPHVVPWNMVKEDSGTGIVHMAPAHGAEDYTALKALGYLKDVPIVCPVDADGRYTSEVVTLSSSGSATTVGESLVDKEVMGDGSKSMVKILETSDLLLAQETIKHRYPYDWKTKKPIIVRATSQWFASLENIKDAALSSLDDVAFHPEVSRSRLTSFVRERSEWCISRQRTWGIPIPALYDVETDEAILTPESLDHIISVLNEKGVQHWFEGPVTDFIPPSLLGSSRTFTKGKDTIDVWFDSGVSWSLLRDILPKDGVEREFLADVCLEGSDQHRGWFQSLLLTAVGTAESGKSKSPYKHLITHGFALDDKGKKMSKSIGNVISPLTIINGGKDKRKEPAYGADALRLWAASVEYGRDVSIGPKILAQSSDALKKIRNTVRFVLANVRDGSAIDSSSSSNLVEKDAMSLADRYVMDQLLQVETTCKDAYASYNFAKVVATLNSFVANTLSSLYFDITKDCLYADAADSPRRRAVLQVLNETLRTLIPIVAPILPHLAEEVHHTLTCRDNVVPALSVFALGWKSVDPSWCDETVVARMQHLLLARSRVNELLEDARRQKHIGGSLEASLQIVLPDAELVRGQHPIAEALVAEANSLATLFIVSDVQILKHGSSSLQASQPMCEGIITDGKAEICIRVMPPADAKCPRCWQRNRPKDQELCDRCVTVVKS
ncbi:isoleucine-tRNA ligase [Tulasnella sp. 330]|nr:isoleucine-tRNA ligase [Tulasnella sp. 330]